jgi:hypothetical protein
VNCATCIPQAPLTFTPTGVNCSGSSILTYNSSLGTWSGPINECAGLGGTVTLTCSNPAGPALRIEFNGCLAGTGAVCDQGGGLVRTGFTCGGGFTATWTFGTVIHGSSCYYLQTNCQTSSFTVHA